MNAFGILLDACPDRWGRTIIQRRRAQAARGTRATPPPCTIYDYLTEAHDRYRLGAIRVLHPGTGKPIDDRDEGQAPPMVRLRELESAARRLDADDDADLPAGIMDILRPGSSLGGARPKATVRDEDGTLWIAKFPSQRDRWDVGACEAIALTLARSCGILVPDVQVIPSGHRGHILLIRRFDRLPGEGRRHVASAMTMTGHQDGEGADDGASYDDIAEVIRRQGATPDHDLHELWRRIAFSMLISNTDDHLRNHAFMWSMDGWRLSPAYDLNPNPGGQRLALGVNGHDASIDLGLALDVAERYRLPQAKAREILSDMIRSVGAWKPMAKRLRMSKHEIDLMAPAFQAGQSMPA
jgi:serine/threonine-protein kinase HipA